MGDYLSVTQAADALGVSTKTVGRWLKAGTLSGVQLPGRGGGEWRIPKADVDRLLTEGAPRRQYDRIGGAARCQAMRADGQPCRGLAMRGSRYCRRHQDQGEP